MKTIPPPCPVPDTGPKYWRSLDALAETPEFREWAEREFPAGASEMTDPVTRRSFVKLMSASFLLAGFGLATTGCRRPVENIYPFSKMPEGYVHGVPTYYATSMPTRRGAVALLAKSSDGRPTKLEGNRDLPDSNGGTDRYTQASILNLYDPDRAMRFAKNGTNATRDEVIDALNKISRTAKTKDGEGLSFLAGQSSSPSRARLQAIIADKLPKAQWCEYEPVDFDIHRQAATLAFGKSVTPVYHFENAGVIVSLDSDFIGGEENVPGNIQRFAQGRKTQTSNDDVSRLYCVEGMMTLTGANADHRLRIPTSAVPAVAARLAVEIFKSSGQGGLPDGAASLAKSPVIAPYEKWIVECAKDLAKNRGKGLVVAGHRQPLAVHLMANAINIALANVSSTLVLLETPESKAGTIGDLVKNINDGKVNTLIILGGNPSYDAPADLEWDKAIAGLSGKTVVRLGYYEDESFPENGWSLPMAHYLESWGDARTADGVVVPVQPLIEPLFGGMTELEVIARVIGLHTNSAYEIVRETLRGFGGNEESWKKFLHDGWMESGALTQAQIVADLSMVADALAKAEWPIVSAPTKDSLEVVFHRDYRMDDGRFNNNGWMQELPDPITKMTWENVFLMSVKTAKDLGVYYENRENNRIKAPVVKLKLDGREIEGPVWTQPGQADNTVALALGYGRKKTGRVGKNSGFDAYQLRTTKAMNFAVGAMLTKLDKTHPLSVTQDHGTMEGRPIIREATIGEYRDYKAKNPEGNFANGFNMEQPPAFQPLYPNPLDVVKKTAHHQWGMAIDLSSCVGCSSCMVACQSENNIPIVGKYQVAANREMHWIRIDRYYTGDPDKEDGIQVINQPMLCQHCEAAPCESVCPVNATVHDQEGLNVMVYNRCVGTRYCSNNCPYKVRRFNFFDYNRRPLEQLEGPVYTTPFVHKTDGELDLVRWWKDPDRGNKPAEEWELLKLVKNPDVTVRMRGVMEKCSYCIQRIQGAEIAQKVKAGATDNVLVPDGTFKTACQQACPAEAIVFGNIADPESQVSKLKAQDRNYNVLDFLNTKPRTTYLARIRNPNPSMPDAYTTPHSTEEFENANHGVNPFESETGKPKKEATSEKRSGIMADTTLTPDMPGEVSRHDMVGDIHLQPPPKQLERVPLVSNQRSPGWISNAIAGVIEAKTPFWWWACFIPSFIMMNVLLAMIVYLMSSGVGLWGPGHPVMWGWAIVNFVWWIGIGHAGTLISAILFLLRQRWRTSINRAAEAMTIFAVMCAGIFPLIHIGRMWFGWWLFPIPIQQSMWPQFRSPLMWDVFAVSTYFTVSVLFWYMGLIPDLAVMRDRAKTKARKFAYGFFSLGWTGSNRHWSNYEKAYLILAGLSTPLVLSVHSIVSLDFSVSQLPGWHTTIFPPYFVAGAVFSGFGMVLSLLVPLRRLLHLEDIITLRHVELMCKVTLATSCIVGYAYAMEFFIAWYSGNPYERFTFMQRVTGPYWWAWLTMVSCNVLLPQLFWLKIVRRSMLTVFILSIFVNIGMWFERFVIIIMPLHRDFVPANWAYFRPTWVDITIYLGTFGLFFTFFLLFIRFVPLIAIAEVKGVTPQADAHHPLGGAKGGHH